jgi:hypothetical protein
LRLPMYSNVWPIDPQSANPPEGWVGWPDKKKFAFVLTHDVDRGRGHDKCNVLAEIEEQLGFRSSFNFVAEDYRVSKKLISDLHAKGFEIGQHGIHHTNHFESTQSFEKLAPRINRYLKEWDAVGFRAPSMYHDLEMVQGLDIEYDASTFDTDPFEPQPDGTGTIFPLWVESKNGRQGYVELPYTLPQDFLLFVLLKERTIDIWKKKLDWIAQQGGMALLIAHPDYMHTGKGDCKFDEYPIELYRQFLEYVSAKYEGQYWHALPREVARFWKEKVARSNKV